jgi:DNA polymerase IV
MNKFGIQTGRDLRTQSIAFLQEHFGKAGAFYYWIARGIDDRPVRANRVRKSVGAENTFAADLFTFEAAREISISGLSSICTVGAEQLRLGI